MPDRRPVAAGRFYSAEPETLNREIDTYLGQDSAQTRPWALMLPHAGHIFCGTIIAATLHGMKLPQNLIILCPNHTGAGKALGVWIEGSWLTPLGPVKVNSQLAHDLINTGTGFQPDVLSHLGEHSIEVLLPFLQKKVKGLEITPVCVGTQNPQVLQLAGHGLASVLKAHGDSAGLIVSSDMNHYENEQNTFAKDRLALAEIMNNDPDGLLATVRKNNISMCGAGSMALALYAAHDLGDLEIVEAAHDTSATVSGDRAHTVGYAGMRLLMKN